MSLVHLWLSVNKGMRGLRIRPGVSCRWWNSSWIIHDHFCSARFCEKCGKDAFGILIENLKKKNHGVWKWVTGCINNVIGALCHECKFTHLPVAAEALSEFTITISWSCEVRTWERWSFKTQKIRVHGIIRFFSCGITESFAVNFLNNWLPHWVSRAMILCCRLDLFCLFLGLFQAMLLFFECIQNACCGTYLLVWGTASNFQTMKRRKSSFPTDVSDLVMIWLAVTRRGLRGLNRARGALVVWKIESEIIRDVTKLQCPRRSTNACLLCCFRTVGLSISWLNSMCKSGIPGGIDNSLQISGVIPNPVINTTFHLQRVGQLFWTEQNHRMSNKILGSIVSRLAALTVVCGNEAEIRLKIVTRNAKTVLVGVSTDKQTDRQDSAAGRRHWKKNKTNHFLHQITDLWPRHTCSLPSKRKHPRQGREGGQWEA